MFKSNAICSHNLELASEDPACCCPLILFSIGDFSLVRFVEFRFQIPNSVSLAMAESWTDSLVCSQGQAGTGCNPCCLYLALTVSFLLVLSLQITSHPSRLVSAAAPWSSLTNEGFCWSQLTNQRPWLNFIHSS